MRVAVLGAGAIGFGLAAYLAREGHAPVLWSPSGKGTAALAAGEKLTATGAVEGSFAVPAAASAAAALEGAEIAIVAVPGNGHRAVMEAAAPHLRGGQVVIVSSLCSLSALHLARLLARRGVPVPIAAWGTTVLSARRTGEAAVNVLTIRNLLDVATLPAGEAAGVAACRRLFGDRFVERADVLAISLSNLNPVVHAALALCNLTRIERGEAWPQYHYLTETVSRLVEGLDAERRAIAAAFGLKVRSVEEHLHHSFGVPLTGLAEIARALHAKRGGPPGPATLHTRFVLEDVPFGLVPTAAIARIARVAVPLHDGATALLGAAYGRDFARDNDLLPVLGLDGLDAAALHARARSGRIPA